MTRPVAFFSLTSLITLNLNQVVTAKTGDLSAKISAIVRFKSFTKNRSQRRMKPFRQEETIYAGLKRWGLKYL
ncbi:MAG: hypothetical protein K940chlam9_00604 [Chlamydiae bacterium]|nr:hypothetical protein [Chlamydiota bacterium]